MYGANLTWDDTPSIPAWRAPLKERRLALTELTAIAN